MTLDAEIERFQAKSRRAHFAIDPGRFSTPALARFLENKLGVPPAIPVSIGIGSEQLQASPAPEHEVPES